MDAAPSGDVWIVGNVTSTCPTCNLPLVLRWREGNWDVVDAVTLRPQTVYPVAARGGLLHDVDALAADDVWAVGDYRNIGGPFTGVTYHWDGQAWSYVDSPIEHMGGSGLEDVVATGPNDVRAIGGADGAVVVMYWDGSQWSLVPAPANSGGSLAAVGPTDLWASGWNGFWHWDGTTWTEVPAAVPGASHVIRGGGMVIVGDCDIRCVGF